MALIRTNRDKYSTNTTILPGIRRVKLDGVVNVTSTDACLELPTISRLSLPVADTEVSYVLPLNTRMFRLKSQSGEKLLLAYSSGGTQYTIPRKTEYCLTDLCADVTLYITSPKSDVTVEIESWAQIVAP